MAVNGKPVGRIEPNMIRPDLKPHGIDPASGFNFNLREPLTETDTLSVLFDDGTLLAGAPFTQHQERLRRLFSGIDIGRMTGLELGPLDRPLLSKRRANVLYVDNAPKAELIEKTRRDSNGTCDWRYITDVDVVWDRPLDQCVPSGRKALFDYCLASHVIEHIPDMIGWLAQIASVLKPGGLINLAVPHKEHTFDYRRRTTNASQFIGWHLRGSMRPYPEQVFDHVAYACPFQADLPFNIGPAVAAARSVVDSDRYVEVHCNVFTEASFLEAFAVIAEAGLLPLACRQMHVWLPGSNEFIVSLAKSAEPPPLLAASYRAQLDHGRGR